MKLYSIVAGNPELDAVLYLIKFPLPMLATIVPLGYVVFEIAFLWKIDYSFNNFMQLIRIIGLFSVL